MRQRGHFTKTGSTLRVTTKIDLLLTDTGSRSVIEIEL